MPGYWWKLAKDNFKERFSVFRISFDFTVYREDYVCEKNSQTLFGWDHILFIYTECDKVVVDVFWFWL